MPFVCSETEFFKIVKRKKGYFSISAVAKMFSVHQQTIRLYEKEGLIAPKRSDGNTRLFSEEDVDRLEEVIYLTHQLGINLAGVEMILKLQKQIKKLQKEINKAFDDTQEQLSKETESYKASAQQSIQRLAELKKQALPAAPKETKKANERSQEALELNQWHIDYEAE